MPETLNQNHADFTWKKPAKVESETPPQMERVNLTDMKDARGRIGKQGFTRDGVFDLLRKFGGMEIAEDASLKEVIEQLKSSPETLERLQTFLEVTPIEISRLPDDTIHLDDGHHRAFIADQIGMSSLPLKPKK